MGNPVELVLKIIYFKGSLLSMRKKLLLLLILVIILLLTLTQSIFAQTVPQKVVDGFSASDTYTEPDGRTKWEKKEDGTIVKYFFGRSEVHRIYYPGGGRKVFNLDGDVILDEKADGRSIIFDANTGKIQNVVEGNQIIHYEDGVRIKIESTDIGGKGINTASKIGDNTYRIHDGKNILFIETNDSQEVISVKHSTSFQKDYKITIMDEDKTTEELLNPIEGTVYYTKTTTGQSVTKESAGFKYSLQVFFIKIFNKPISIEATQDIFDKTFTKE